MKRLISSKSLTVFFTMAITMSVGVFFIYFDAQSAFGFEENILALQSGIISTSNQDYAISQEFETRIFQDGKIMRLSGMTTTGEQYYLYQKIVGDDIVVRGKIFTNNAFVSIVQKYELEAKTPVHEKDPKDIIVLIKQPPYSYYYDTYTLTAKAYDAKLNPRANFDQTQGYVEGIKINVALNQFDELLTSFAGITNQFGTFTGKYLWGYTDSRGEYNVTVTIDDGESTSTQFYNTFYRGYVSNFTG